MLIFRGTDTNISQVERDAYHHNNNPPRIWWRDAYHEITKRDKTGGVGDDFPREVFGWRLHVGNAGGGQYSAVV